MDLAPGTRVDRYVVDGVLGRGGMATVYRVTHATLGTTHALKVLLLPVASIRDRLVREGRAQATLRHPNVVAVTDVIEVDGSPALVMELIAGPTLEAWLRTRRVDARQADALARGLLDGVAAAHAQGLVHRDLKPGNVLLDPSGGTLVPKITDFGLAKLLGSEAGPQATRSGATLGTPAYMAPEQIRDASRVDGRADVYALGAILYEILARRRAYDGDDLLEVFDRVRRGDRIPLAEAAPLAPAWVVDAVEASLSPDPDARPATVEALRAAWTDGGRAEAPTDVWSPAEVVAARSLAPQPSSSSVPPPSGATWTDELPSASPAAPPPRRRWPWVAGIGALLIGGLALVAVRTDDELLDADEVPDLGVSRPAQRDFAEGWRALLELDISGARRRLDAADREVDDARLDSALAATTFLDRDSEANEAAVAAAASRPAGSPGRELADLLGQGRREAARTSALYAEHLASRPDDLLACVVATYECQVACEAADTLSILDGCIERHGRLPYLLSTQAFLFDGLDRADERDATLAELLRASPDVAAPHWIAAGFAVDAGALDRAREEAAVAWRIDPGFAARQYAVVLLLQGDAAAYAPIEAAALSPEAPTWRRIDFLVSVAEIRAGMGQVAAADADFRRAAQIARAERKWMSVADIAGSWGWTRDRLELDPGPALELLHEALAAPEIPELGRAAHQVDLFLFAAVQALRAGRTEAANDALDRADRAGGLHTKSSRRVRAWVAGSRGDRAALEAMEALEPRECLVDLAYAHLWSLAGDLEAAEARWERVLGAPAGERCGVHGTTSSRPIAASHLAELRARRGDVEGARAAIEAWRTLWTAADGDLPASIRVRAAEENLRGP